MILIKDNTCSVLKSLPPQFHKNLEVLSQLSNRWQGEGCLLVSAEETGEAAYYCYQFDFKGTEPSTEELKQANDALDRLLLRLMDLDRLIDVVKAVNESQSILTDKSITIQDL